MTEPRAWTDDDDSVLVEMKSRFKSAEEIAELLGRTPSAVKNRFNVIGSGGGKKRRDFSAQIAEWPEMPPNAFQDIKVKPDPAMPLSKPQDRTLARVVGVL